MNQFAQMKTMLTSFLAPRQETTKRAFCNYLASDVENLEKRDFQTFQNEALKLLSRIQSRAEERTRQPQQPTLPGNSSATSTHVPTTYHQQQQPAVSAMEYIQRQLHFTISLSKVFNPLSLQPTIHFWEYQSVMSYLQMDKPQLLTPNDPHQHIASPPTTQQQEL